MIITSNVIKSNFILMFFAFLVYEVILMTCLVILYYHQMKKVNPDIIQQITDNNSEVLNSYNVFLEEELSNYANTLMLINKHLSLLDNTADLGAINANSPFASSYSSDCVISYPDSLSIDTKYEEMFDINSESNIVNKITTTNHYFKEGIESYNNQMIIDIISDIVSLRYISSIKGKDQSICFIQIILKAILIENIVLGKRSTSLQNVFIIGNDRAFLYPPNNKTEDYLKLFSVFQCTDSSYSISCFPEKLIKDKSDSNYPYLIDNDLFVWTCMHKLTYNICLQNDLKIAIDKIKMPNMQLKIASLSMKDNKENNIITDIIILASPNHTITEMNQYFTSEYLSSKFKNQNELHLFHLIYYEIFQYKNSVLTQEEVSRLETQYNNTIIPTIHSHINKTEKWDSINITQTQTFLDYDYNITGDLDKGKR